MRKNAEINPLPADGAEVMPPAVPQPHEASSLSSSYRDRLKRWAIARLEPEEVKVIVSRFRSYSDAEGHLKFLRHQFPLEKFVIIVEK